MAEFTLPWTLFVSSLIVAELFVAKRAAGGGKEDFRNSQFKRQMTIEAGLVAALFLSLIVVFVVAAIRAALR